MPRVKFYGGPKDGEECEMDVCKFDVVYVNGSYQYKSLDGKSVEGAGLSMDTYRLAGDDRDENGVYYRYEHVFAERM
jgi:hypothetical protein